MGMQPPTDDDLRLVAKAAKEYPSKAQAAAAMKMSVSTFKDWYKRAIARGLDGSVPEPVPEGLKITGTSTLYGPDGLVKGQWVKTKAEPEAIDVAEVIKAAFDDFTPLAPSIIRPTGGDDDRLTAYIFCDWHVGLFAYGEETGGPDWDLSIARKVLIETAAELIDQSPKSKHALILGLGDLLHADNANNQTERSKNVLDVDTRYSKCVDTIVDLMVESSQMIAVKHEQVELVLKPGNHDPYSTVGLRQALRMYYRNEERVVVDTSPNPFYFRRFGVNLIAGVHGDKAKPKQLPLIMANMRPTDWGQTSTRHWHTGHVHHDTEKEDGGVHVYSHRAPVAQDAYHAHEGYLSGRSMKSFSYDAQRGCRGRTEIEIK
jgi:hypothetical protein